MKIRHAELNDLDALAELKASVWGRAGETAWKSRWSWQFRDHPLRPKGVASNFLCVELDGRIVGGIGWMPVQIRVPGRELLSAFTCDAFVNKDLQRSGVGRMLTDTVARQYPISLWMNCSPPLVSFLRKNRFDEVSPILQSFLVVDPRQILVETGHTAVAALSGWTTTLARAWANRRARTHRLPAGFVLREDREFSEAYDALDEQQVEDVAHIRKGRDYLRWRYSECPIGSYRIRSARCGDELVGFTVFRVRSWRGRPVGVVNEVVAHPRVPGLREALLASAVSTLLQEPIAFVMALRSDARVATAVKRVGFVATRRTPYLFVTPGAASTTSLTTNGRQWNLSLGDCDLDYV